MRVLFATSPWPTHYYMTVPTAWAFRAAGHEVLVASQPSITGLITRSGLPAAAVGPDIDLVAIRRRTLPHERAAHQAPPEPGADTEPVFDLWQEATMANLDPLVAAARAWRPDLVVCDPMCPTGLVAARVLGVPGIRHLWAPDFLGSAGTDEMIATLPGFAEPYRSYGLEIDGDPAARTIDPCPPSMEPPPAPTRRHVRFVPYNGPAGTAGPPLPRSRRPRICLTWGLSVTRIVGTGAFLLPRVIEAVSGLGVDIVVAIDSSQRSMLGAVPDGVTVLEQAPLHMLVPGCDVIVHQGGAGSTLTAAREGLRQLALTHLPDQANVAIPMARTGAGRHLHGDEATSAAIRAAVAELLDDQSYRRAADRLREEMRAQPTPSHVVAELADLAAPRRSQSCASTI